MNGPCPDLEALFTQVAEGAGSALEHAQACPACSAVLAEHRELERELFHLSDPLPPASFVPAVMARVATSPAPARREIWVAMSVLATSVTASAIALFTRPGAVGHIGVSTAETARNSFVFMRGLEDNLGMLWRHAAVPAAGVLCVLLLVSLFGLKKLVGATPALNDVRMAP
jgi:hypothetical protein